MPSNIHKVKLEVWGASAPGETTSGGGYSYGIWNVTQNTLYITCGGRGRFNLKNYSYTVEAAGYNGGGEGQCGGGGATHIALRLLNNQSILKDYINSQDDVLIVAGGAGGGDDYIGGYGGGLQGGNGTGSNAKGGTQTEGGTGYNNGQFGVGGAAANQSDSASAGGGGWYGGGSSTLVDNGGGGGGSGHLNDILQSPKGMENNKNLKSGMAVLTCQI